MSIADDMKQPDASAALKQLKDAFRGMGGDGDFSIASLAGLSDEELKAAYATACQKLTVGDLDEASKLFGLLCLMKYNEAKHWRGLGLCFHRKKQWPMADFAYTRAITLDPKDVCALAFHAEVLLWTNRKMAAQMQAEKAIAVQRENPKREFQPYLHRAEAVLAQVNSDNSSGQFEG